MRHPPDVAAFFTPEVLQWPHRQEPHAALATGRTTEECRQRRCRPRWLSACVHGGRIVAENWPARTESWPARTESWPSCLTSCRRIPIDRGSAYSAKRYCIRPKPPRSFARASSTFYWLPLRLCCAFGRAAAGCHIPIRIENDRPMRSTVVGDVFVEPHHYQTRPTVRTPLIVVSGSHGVLRTAQSQQIQRLSSARRPQRCLTRTALPSLQFHDATCARIRLLAGSQSLERPGPPNNSMSSKLETSDIAERSAPGGGTRGSPRRDARAASA
jgi:hypothetical protein